MRRLLLTLLLVLGCAGIASAQRSVTVTGTVRDINGSLYVNGTGRASIIPPTGVQQPVVNIVSLGSSATFSVQVADTSQVQPVNTAKWQFSFCSQGYVNQNGQTSQYCFTMISMPIVGPGPIDISTQIQAQAIVLPTVVGGAFTAGGDLSGSNVSQTLTGIQGHGISAGSPAVGNFLRYNGTNWLATLLTSGDIPNNAANTSGQSATTIAFAATPTGCTGVNFSQGITATGTANCAQPSDITGNAVTATNLFGTPTQCSANNAPLGILSNGNAAGCFSVNQFSGLIPGTNANGPLHIGSGGSLDAIGTGAIHATDSLATAGTPTKCISTQAATGINSDFSAAGCFTPGGGPPGGSTFDVQINNAGNLASGVTNQANVGVVGNIARKNNATDAVEYASPAGNDSNDGLSWGTAKLTVLGACEALPSGATSPATCGTGTVYFADSTYAQPTTTCGLWLMGSTDPNWLSPPTCWIKITSALTVIGIPTGSHGPNAEEARAILNGGSGSDINHPTIWISGSTIPMWFQNIAVQYPGRGIVISQDSNLVYSGCSHAGSTGMTFDNVTVNLNAVSGNGPAWDIGGCTFWLKIRNSGASADAANSPTADNAQAFLYRIATDGNASEVDMRDTHLANGGITYYGSAIGTVNIDGVYGEALNTPAAVWIKSGTVSGRITNVTLADSVGNSCASGGVCAVENDSTQAAANLSVSAYRFAGVYGPMTLLGGSTSTTGLVDSGTPYVQGQNGFINGYVYGNTNAARRLFSPTAVKYANLAPTSPSSWISYSGGVTITSGIAAPDGTTGAGRVTSVSATSNIDFVLPSFPSLAAGDWIVVGVWTRANSGAWNGGTATTIAQASCAVTGTGSQYGVAPPADGSWGWATSAFKIATVGPGSCSLHFSGSAASTVGGSIDYYAPTMLYIPAGTIPDTEVQQIWHNLVPYSPSCVLATLCGTGVTWQAPNLVVSSIAPSTSPICPNGTGGALTTSGCSGGGGGSSIIVNGGSPVVSPANLQNGAASLGDTFNMVQSGSNISAQLAAGSVRTVPGGGTGVATLTVHGPLIGEGVSPIAAAGAGLIGQCFLSNGSGADPAFSNCPTGFTNPMVTVGDTIYGGGGGTATKLAGPTTPNGVSETLVEIPSSGAANPPQWSLAGVPVDAQTGPGYTVGVTDRASLITLSNAAPQNLTLVDPATAGFGSSFPFIAKNIGTAAWTNVCTTFLCNGSASLLLPPNWSQFVWSNNSTYTVSRFPNFDAFANNGTNAAETFNSTTGVFGSLAIGPASSTDSDLACFNGTGGLPLKDCGILGTSLTSNSVSGTTNAMPKWSAAHTLTNSTLQDDATNVKLTTEPLDLVTKPELEEVANASSTGTTVNKLAKLTGAPSTAVITTAGDTEFEGIVVGGAGTTGNAQIAAAGSAVSCVFDSGTTAGDYVQNSASVNGDCTDAGATRPTSGGKIVGKVLSTNGGAGTYAVLAYGPDHPAISTSGGSAPTLKTNGSNNTDQTALNLQNSAATNGVTLTLTNTGTSNVQLGLTGTLNNTGLTNPSVAVDNVTCTLGSTCSLLATGYATATGSVNAMSASTPACPVSLTAGLAIKVLANLANTTTTPTLNYCTLGAKNILKSGTVALRPGDYSTTLPMQLTYDGTQWQLMNPIIPAHGVVWASSWQKTSVTNAPTAGTVVSSSPTAIPANFLVQGDIIKAEYNSEATTDGTHTSTFDLEWNLNTISFVGGNPGASGLPCDKMTISVSQPTADQERQARVVVGASGVSGSIVWNACSAFADGTTSPYTNANGYHTGSGNYQSSDDNLTLTYSTAYTPQIVVGTVGMGTGSTAAFITADVEIIAP